jgi:glycosyltransferase involved in cell wall biosynthesis
MASILVLTQRFYPPWSDGTASYAKGLVDTALETSKSRKDLEITVLSSSKSSYFPELIHQEKQKYLGIRNGNLECFYSSENRYEMNLWRLVGKLSETKGYDVTHILLPGFNPLWVRLATKKRNVVIKHVFIYPFHPSFKVERFAYSFLQKRSVSKIFNINLAFSTKILEQIYHTDGIAILPPSIDTSFYRPKSESGCSYQALMKSTLKIGNINEVLQKDFVLLYMGPLLHERFNFRSVIGCFTRLRKEYNLNVGLVIVGRELGNTSASYLEEIKNYASKNNLSQCVFACLKNLSEAEKVCLFNKVHVFIYPFPIKPCRMSIVFPPIALLESMSAGLCVVSGGLPYLSDLIKNNENGTLINEIINVKVFAEGVWNALMNKRKISQNARLTVEKDFSIQRVSKLYEDFLSKIGV